MRRYLLDTNILSQIIKQPQSAVAEKNLQFRTQRILYQRDCGV